MDDEELVLSVTYCRVSCVACVVRVGYEFVDCHTIYWRTQSTVIPAHDISSSHIGAWNFHVHHSYNFHQGQSVSLAAVITAITLCTPVSVRPIGLSPRLCHV